MVDEVVPAVGAPEQPPTLNSYAPGSGVVVERGALRISEVMPNA